MVMGLASSIALRCPDCPPAREVRTMWFSLDVLHNLVVALSPFVVTLAIILVIVRAVSSRSARGGTDADDTNQI
jgi:hypothetical protein